MNLQTERIENHRAQLTIEIEMDQLDAAKKQAARQISRRVRIKGFRKGKAPYRLIAQYVGEAAILEEALESLGDDLYKQALQESDILPYGPGAFDDFKVEPAPTFIFTVPLQPEVDLKDYADIRLDFESPAVDDDEVEQSLQQLRMREVEVLDAELKVAELGNRVHVSVDSEFVDGEEPADKEEEATDEVAESAGEQQDPAESEPDGDAEEEETPYIPKKGDTFVKEDNTVLILDPNEDSFVDGFVEALVDAELGSDIVFELTIPDDDPDKTIANRRVSFVVTMKQIESILVPELDNEFAERISKNRGDEIQDLDGLRQLIREDLQKNALDRAKQQYSGQVLQKIVEGATIEYPELMLSEHIDELISEFAESLKRQNLSLDDYFRFTGSTREELQEQYRDRADTSLRQRLVLREFAESQEVDVDDEQIEMRMDLVVAGYGHSPEIRKLFDTPQMRGNLRNELMMSNINARLYALGQGEDVQSTIEDLQAQLATDAQMAKERSERLQGYLQAAPAAAAGSTDSEPEANSEDGTSEDDITNAGDGVLENDQEADSDTDGESEQLDE